MNDRLLRRTHKRQLSLAFFFSPSFLRQPRRRAKESRPPRQPDLLQVVRSSPFFPSLFLLPAARSSRAASIRRGELSLFPSFFPSFVLQRPLSAALVGSKKSDIPLSFFFPFFGSISRSRPAPVMTREWSNEQNGLSFFSPFPFPFPSPLTGTPAATEQIQSASGDFLFFLFFYFFFSPFSFSL